MKTLLISQDATLKYQTQIGGNSLSVSLKAHKGSHHHWGLKVEMKGAIEDSQELDLSANSAVVGILDPVLEKFPEQQIDLSRMLKNFNVKTDGERVFFRIRQMPTGLHIIVEDEVEVT